MCTCSALSYTAVNFTGELLSSYGLYAETQGNQRCNVKMMLIGRQLRLGCLAVLTVCLYFCKDVFSLDCNMTITINSSNSEGVFSSPSFPSSYPKLPEAYSCWLTLIPDDPDKDLWLTFDDFHLSSEYVHHNMCDAEEFDYLAIYSGSTVTKYCGCRRPDMLIHDEGEVRLELHVRPARIDESAFRAFQARYQYLAAAERMNLNDIYLYSAKPDISSGYHMVEVPISPLPAAVNSRVIDGLYYIEAAPEMKISLTAYILNADSNSGPIEIRDGLTSQAPLLYDGTLEQRTEVISTQSSMYIRWRGVIRDATLTLSMDIIAFKEPSSRGECADGNSYFYCKNHRCIKSTLTCDSIDNCGDGSDEARDSLTDICHEDICDPSPCLNGGTCSTPGPSCRCRYGYYGDFCQSVNNDCFSMPCQNGGTCEPMSNGPGFICFCKGNFLQPLCQESTPCRLGDCNEGNCIDGVCICKDKYYGNRCEFVDNSTNTDYTDLQHTSIMIGAFVGAVCLLSICWLIAMARKRQSDEPVGRVTRIVSVHSRDERGMRPSVTAAGAIDLPPNYSDCVFDDTDSTPPGKRNAVPAVITEENEEEPDGDVFIAEEEQGEGPPLSPPPTYESVALSEDEDGIVFEVQRLPDVVSQDRLPHRQTSHTDTAV
ncbi:uncharacterized protein LOC119726596 isoform X2 [Patiria miniata]|uniref:Uncharacterized protein n=1 Tax=Patiria miniata TaxID=46514 RepID=A0A913ZRI2_PATMI|nr:uncharacterized protein LOC119726596 isoform X2 [Patiria miniata]